MNNKVAIYTRVSTVHQIDKESLSIQKKDLINYAQLVLGINDYEVFEDAGYSGKDTDRPAFQRMMDRIKSGEFSHLLVWKIDRVSRNLLDFSEMYSKLKEIGVIFISKNEQFDTSSAIGEAMLKIILVFAELERQMASERVSAAMLSRASDGKWNGGTIPYGYDYNKDTKEVTINEKEAKIVRRIFTLYEETHSTLSVTKHLNIEKLRNRNGNLWNATHVYRILINPFTSGCYVYNMYDQNHKEKPRSEWIVVENHHPAIISKRTQDYIIDMLHSRKRGKGGDIARMYKHTHVFTDLIECGICGTRFSGYMGKSRVGGFKPSEYRCNKRFRYGTICNNKYTSDSYIGPFMFNYISNLIKLSTCYNDNLFDDEIYSLLINNPCFKGVAGLSKETYSSIRAMMSTAHGSESFNPTWMFESADSEDDNEPVLIKSKILKDETALNRLNSLYLYGSEELDKAEYLKAYKDITTRIEENKKLLNQFGTNDLDLSLNKAAEFAKASYILLMKELASGQFFDYKKFATATDPMVPKQFMKSVVKKIVMVNARITSITFINGQTHEFIY